MWFLFGENLVWVIVGVGVVGFFLFFVKGFRGRKIDDFLYCVGCGYCLEGLSEPLSCVECGKKLGVDGSVVEGCWVRRMDMFWKGFVFVLVMLIWGIGGQMVPDKHKPVGWQIVDVKSQCDRFEKAGYNPKGYRTCRPLSPGEAEVSQFWKKMSDEYLSGKLNSSDTELVFKFSIVEIGSVLEVTDSVGVTLVEEKRIEDDKHWRDSIRWRYGEKYAWSLIKCLGRLDYKGDNVTLERGLLACCYIAALDKGGGIDARRSVVLSDLGLIEKK